MKKFIFVLFLCVSLLYSGCKWKDIFAPKNDNSDSVSILSTTETGLTTLTTNVVLTNVVDKSFMTNNRMGEWLFLTNFRDSSVNSNHSIPFGEVAIMKNCGRPSKIASLSLSSCVISNKVTISSANCLDFTNDFTISLWVDLNEVVTTGGYIFSRKSESNPNEGWGLYCNLTNSFQFNSVIVDVGSSFFDEYVSKGWLFISITYVKEIKNLKFYINKVLLKEETLTNINFPTGSGCDILLGVEYSSSTPCLDCWMSEFRLFNKALTTNEMNYLYGL